MELRDGVVVGEYPIQKRLHRELSYFSDVLESTSDALAASWRRRRTCRRSHGSSQPSRQNHPLR